MEQIQLVRSSGWNERYRRQHQRQLLLRREAYEMLRARAIAHNWRERYNDMVVRAIENTEKLYMSSEDFNMNLTNKEIKDTLEMFAQDFNVERVREIVEIIDLTNNDVGETNIFIDLTYDEPGIYPDGVMVPTGQIVEENEEEDDEPIYYLQEGLGVQLCEYCLLPVSVGIRKCSECEIEN